MNISEKNELREIGKSLSKEFEKLALSCPSEKNNLKSFLKYFILSKANYLLGHVPFTSEKYKEKKIKKYYKFSPFLLSKKVRKFSFESSKIIQKSDILKDVFSGIMKMHPKISAIIPNYNHDKYLFQRINSVLRQTYPFIDVLILDDASTDNSKEIIEKFCTNYPDRVRAIYNNENSESIFSQWQKGIDQSDGDLIWICESDDFCETDFIEKLIPSFDDQSVMLAFGKIEFVDSNGQMRPGLDQYRNSAERGIWHKSIQRPAKQWFDSAFGVKNVIPNVGGALWRRRNITDQVWQNAKNFKVMGDWYLYLMLSDCGQIEYCPDAVSYFRIHDKNTSVIAQKDISYYREYINIINHINNKWKLRSSTIKKFKKSCKNVFLNHNNNYRDFEKIFNENDNFINKNQDIHVMIGILGFSFGGGEIFPIQLANALSHLGVSVSIFQYSHTHDEPDVRKMLSPSIPVYNWSHVGKKSLKRFFHDTGVSIFHSHVGHFEKKMLQGASFDIPYVVTLHGSYESIKYKSKLIELWVKKVNTFFYLSDKNLEPFDNKEVTSNKFRKIRNGMPIIKKVSNLNRKDLGINNDAIVFTLVGRAIDKKGWIESIHAFIKFCDKIPNVDSHLILVGDGPIIHDARNEAQNRNNIHFLGYRSDIHEIYDISDVAIAPTRFPGESFPLCLIEAMQVGTPILATDIGDIKIMTSINSENCGIIIENTENDKDFIEELSTSMEKFLDKNKKNYWSCISKKAGENFSIDKIASEYLESYRNIVYK